VRTAEKAKAVVIVFMASGGKSKIKPQEVRSARLGLKGPMTRLVSCQEDQPGITRTGKNN
jgi:hypothetical protein